MRLRPAVRRRTAALLALSVGAAALTLTVPLAQPAQAASVRPLTNAYDQDVYGDFALVGNGNIRCPLGTDTGVLAAASGAGSCTTGNTRGSTAVNDNFDMQWNVLAGSATGIFNSSSATITVPAGATIAFARLYWSGTTGYRQANTVAVGCGSLQSTRGVSAPLPPQRATAPVVTNSAQTTPVQLSVAGAAPVALLPGASYVTDRTSISNTSSEYYSAYADVTAQIEAAPKGSAQTISVGNVWTPRGFNCYAGWSLAYVFKYDQPNATYAPNLRSVQIFDGHVRQFTGEPDTTLPISGLHMSTNTARVGVTSYEGDYGIVGDRMLINGTAVGEPMAPATLDNFFTSSADGRLSPNVANNYSVDAKTFSTTLIPAGSTSANLTFSTTQDSWLTQNVILSTPEPEIRVSKTPSATTVRPGSNVTYTVTVSNPSAVALTNVSVSDAQFPACSRSGLGNLAANASLTYTCDTTAPASDYANAATATATDTFGDTLSYTTTSTPVDVIHPAITLTKTADQTSYNSGDTITFTLRATNSGDARLNAVTVADPSATGCNRTFATMTAGAVQTWTCTATAPFSGGSNTASVTAQDDTGAPVTANATAPAPTNGSIGGRVFADVNGNGAVEATDTGVSGVSLTLTGTTTGGATISRTVTSGSDGSWNFTAVPPGTYRVSESQPAGYTDGTDTPGSGATSTVNDTVDLTLGDAATSTGTLFAERPTGSVAGTVYEDQNADGTKQGAEPGIGSVTINLTGTDDGGNSVSRTTTTAADGTYGFTGLRAGTYILSQPTQPAGYVDGREAVGTVNGTTRGTTSGTDSITGIVLPAAGTAVGYTFGEVRTATLTGSVTLDGTPSPTAVTVTLTGTDDLGAAVNRTASTGTTGTFVFGTLRPGSYTVTETQPTAYGAGTATNGTPGGTVSGANSITGIPLASGTNAAGYLFNDTSSSLSGQVFEDLDRDGVLDAGEPGYGSNLTVTITGPGGTRTPLTSATGTYSVSGLAAGTYSVSFAAPGGSSLTSPGTRSVTVPAGTAVPDNNFGVRQERAPTAVNDSASTPWQTAVTIPVLVNDSDPDGDAVTVQSYTQPAHGTVTGTTGPLSYTPAAGWTGPDTFTYTITDGRSGTSTATVTVTTGPKPNDPPVFGPQGTNDAQTVVVGGPLTALTGSDPDADPITFVAGPGLPAGVTLNANGSFTGAPATPGTYTSVITLSDNRGGSTTKTLTITVRPTGSISGRVFADVNGNGVVESGDTGIGGVTVVLSGQPDQVGAPVLTATITSQADGSWTFSGIPAGVYGITETQPTGFVTSINTPGTAATLSGGDGFQITLVDAGTSIGNSFGERPQASLAGTVYDDTNANGTKQGAEPGLGGVTITVTGTDEAGNPVNRTTTTAADGSWTVGSLRAGSSYTVTETQPAGYLDGREVAGTSGGTLSGADTISGINLGRTSVATGYLFGEVRATSLAGTVTRDGSVAQANVTITLTGTDDLGAAVSATTLSSGSGAWSFGGLRPGTYRVVQTQPTAYGAGTATAGTTGGTVNGANTVQAITLASGAIGTGYVFNDVSGTISGSVFEDLNRNATKEAAEPGYLTGGWTVTLAGPAGTATTTTAADGTYSFAGLAAGSYTASFTAPAGASLTSPASQTFTLVAGGTAPGKNFGLRRERAPLATDDTAATAYQSAVTIAVLANDSDPDGDPLTVTTHGLAADGSVTCTATTCSYTPNAGFTGTDTFTYTITDSRTGTSTATVQTTVGAAPNQPPTYTSATANTAQTVALGGAVTPVAATDPEGQAITYALVSGALPPGVTAVNGNGSFTGAPTVPGSYAVAIRATDPLGAFTTTNLTITVPPAANQPPTYTADPTNDAQALPVNGILAALRATDPEGGTLTYGPATGTMPPGVTLNDDGSFSGRPTTPGTYVLTIPVTDPAGGTDSTTLTVTVTNQPPAYTNATSNVSQIVSAGFTPVQLAAIDPETQLLTFGPPSSGSLPPGITLNPDGTFSGVVGPHAVAAGYVAVIPVSDPFGGTDTTTLTIDVPVPANAPPAYTSATSNTAQTVTLGSTVTALQAVDPEGQAVTYGPILAGSLPPGVTGLNSDGTFTGSPSTPGSYAVTIPAFDPAGASTTTTLTITVPAAPNTPPSFGPEATNTSQTVPVGGGLTGLTTSDPEGDTPLVVTQVSGSVPPGVAVNPNGTFSGNPSTPGTYLATFRVTDPGGLFAEHVLTVTVPPANQPPAYTPAPGNTGQSVPVDGSVGPVVALDPEGQTVTYLLVGGTLPAGVTLNPDGTFSGSPTQVGSSTVTILAEDPQGLSTTTTLVIDVPNRSPVFTAGSSNTSQSVNVGDPLAPLAAVDPDHQPLTYGPVTSGSLPPGIALEADGTFSGTVTTPGTYPVDILVDDGHGGSATTTLVITVANRNPVIASGDETIVRGDLPTVLLATDPDGDGLTFTAANGSVPAGLTLGSDGSWTGTTTTHGVFSFDLTVTDSRGGSTVKAITITVQGPPTYTSAAGNTGQTVFVDGPVAAVVATDPEGGALTYTLASGTLPPGVTLNSNGSFTGSPTGTGSWSITITATDVQGLTADTALTITAPNRLPVFGPEATNGVQTVGVGRALTPLTGTDPDHQPLTFTTLSTLPPGVQALNVDGSWLGTPTTPGAYTLTIVLSDGQGGVVNQPLTITVPAGAPYVTSDPNPVIVLGDPLPPVTATDPEGDPITFSVPTPGQLPPGVTLSPDGTWTGTPATPGSYPIDVTVTDNHGETSTTTITITVQGPPTFTGAPTNTGQQVVVDGPLTPLAASDPESGPLVYTVTGGSLPPGVTLNPDGTFTGSPTAVNPGSSPATPGGTPYSVTITTTDPQGLTDSTVLVIDVPNRDPVIPPTATNDAQAVPVGSTPLPLTGTDPDHQTTLTWTTTSTLPAGITLNPDGSWSGPATGVAGSFPVTVTLTDGNGGTTTHDVTLTVTTGSPVVTSPPTQTIPVGGTPTPITATDPDSDPVTYSVPDPSQLPPGVTLNPDGTWTGPSTGPGGSSYPVVVVIDDGHGGTTTTTVTITIDAPPVYTGDPQNDTQTVHVDQPLAPVRATDPETEPLTYTITGGSLPPGVTLNPDGTFTGSPTAVNPGSTPADPGGTPYEVTITATDPYGQTTTTVLTIDVPNRPPTFGSEPTNSSQTVAQGGSGTPLTSNDPDHQPPTYAVPDPSQLPPGLVLNPDGTWTGTPSAPGTYPVEVTVTDNHGGTVTTTLTLTVPIPNQPPLYTSAPTNTVQTVLVGTPLTGLLATDPENQPLFHTLTAGILPPGVTLNADGTFTGLPTVAGTWSFDVTVSDELLLSDTTTVLLTVTAPPVNQPPAFTGAADNTAQTVPAGGTPDRVVATDPESDPLTYTVTGGALPPGVTLDPDGTFAGPASPPGTYTVQIMVSDGQGGADVTTLVITVPSLPNTAPTAVDDTRSTQHDTAVPIAVRGNDVDVDGDPLTVTAVTQGANGSVAIVSGDPVFTPDLGFSGQDSFTYTISDGRGGLATATVTVTVAPAPNAPPAYTAAPTNTTQTVRPGAVLTALAATDPTGETLTYAAVSGALPPGVTLLPDGSFDGSPTTPGTYTVAVLVSDPAGGTDLTTLVVTVPANGLPVAVGDSATTPYDTARDVPVLTNDTDPDGDTLTVLSVTSPLHGTATLVPGGLVHYVPATGYSGPDTVDYTVSDGHGGSATATVTLTVQAPPVVNQLPTANPDAATTTSGSAVGIPVTTNDTDPDGGTLTVITVAQPAFGGVEPGFGATLVYRSVAGFVGTDTFTYVVSDGQGGVDSTTVTVTVLAPNGVPVAVADDGSTHGTAAVTIAVIANDTDPDGEALVVTGTSTPGHGGVVVAGGSVVYTPAAGFVGTDTFTYTISDGHGGTAAATVTVTVDANQAPVATADQGRTKTGEPTVVQVLPNDTDPDGDVLSVVDFTQPSHGRVELVDGAFTYTPDSGWLGADTFTYTVSDGNGGVRTQTVTVTTTGTSAESAVPTLPRTGSQTTVLLAWGLALLAGGGLLLLLGRRRES